MLREKHKRRHWLGLCLPWMKMCRVCLTAHQRSDRVTKTWYATDGLKMKPLNFWRCCLLMPHYSKAASLLVISFNYRLIVCGCSRTTWPAWAIFVSVELVISAHRQCNLRGMLRSLDPAQTNNLAFATTISLSTSPSGNSSLFLMLSQIVNEVVDFTANQHWHRH